MALKTLAVAGPHGSTKTRVELPFHFIIVLGRLSKTREYSVHHRRGYVGAVLKTPLHA